MWLVGGDANMRAMSIARFAVNRRVAVSMIALAIVVLGVFALPRLPVTLLPNFTPPVVTVTVNYPNVGPEQMEALVTRPIENAVSRVNGIELINSSSQLGQSSVSAQFYYGTNLDTAAVDVQQQVDQIRSQLPNDPNLQQPQIAKFDSNSLPVVRFYVTDPNMPLRDLGDLFANQLSDEFASVDGVANVIVAQDQTRAFMIEPDASKLAAYGMTLNQIIGRVQQENLNLPAGIIQVGPNEYQVRANALLANAQRNLESRACGQERQRDSYRDRGESQRLDSRAAHLRTTQWQAGDRRGDRRAAQRKRRRNGDRHISQDRSGPGALRRHEDRRGLRPEEFHPRSDQRARAHGDLRRDSRRPHHSALLALVAHHVDRGGVAADLGARHALRCVRAVAIRSIS